MIKILVTTLIIFFSINICTAQSQWLLQTSLSRQFTGYATFIDLVKKNKKHEFYIGIGKHINATKTDVSGTGEQINGQGFAYTFSQSILYKAGYRKYIGINNKVQFFPYIELVEANIGLYYTFFGGNGSGEEYLYVDNIIYPTAIFMINTGIGAKMPINDKIKFMAQGGICPTYVLSKGHIYNQTVTQPIIWQIGIQIKLSK